MWDALIANCAAMGFLSQFINFWYASSFFPGTNLLWGIIIASVLSLATALTYSLMSIAMPRTGGDYLWVSRFISPPVGFMVSFFLTVIMLLWMGSCAIYMVTPYLTSLFFGLGVYFSNPWFTQLATFLQEPMQVFIIGALFTLIAFIPMFYSAKATMNAIKAFVILSLIGAIAWLIAMIFAGQTGFVSRFDSLSGTTYSQVLAAVTEAGVPQFSLSGTLIGTSYIFLGLVGYNMTAYFSGEIKEVRKSQMIGIPLAILLVQGFSLICTFVLYEVVGGYWWNGLNALFWAGNPAYTLPDWATAYYLTIFASPNALPLILFCIGGICQQMACTTLIIPFAATRNMFAWSFDRVIPTKIAEVDKRGIPRLAVFIALITGLVALWATVFTTYLQYYTYSITGWYLVMTIASLAAVIFPFTQKGKAILEQAPAVARARIGSVYVVSIVGAISAAISAFTVYTSLTPAIIGLMRFDYIATLIGTFAVGVVIYYISYAYNKRKGIPIDLAHKEIPPA